MSKLHQNTPSSIGNRHSVFRTPYSALRSQLPSRHSNPFATCWTRPGAIPFHFPDGESTSTLLARLEANNWWGEIVGPHGSGKSTLLETLKPALLDARCHIRTIALRDGQRWLPCRVSHTRHTRLLLIVDGFEQLNWISKLWLKHRCRRAGAGLLVTSHAPTGLPTLITLAPSAMLVQQLVAELSKHAPTPASPADVAASLAVRGSNVRDVFFDLYDRHERLRDAC